MCNLNYTKKTCSIINKTVEFGIRIKQESDPHILIVATDCKSKFDCGKIKLLENSIDYDFQDCPVYQKILSVYKFH